MRKVYAYGASRNMAAIPPELSADASTRRCAPSKRIVLKFEFTRAGERLERGVDFAHGEETGIAI
jgi:hypothetical protein